MIIKINPQEIWKYVQDNWIVLLVFYVGVSYFLNVFVLRCWLKREKKNRYDKNDKEIVEKWTTGPTWNKKTHFKYFSNIVTEAKCLFVFSPFTFPIMSGRNILQCLDRACNIVIEFLLGVKN